MKLKFFSVDALEPDDDQSVVDSFCTRHRLISIDKRFVERGDYCYWSVCVTYLEPSSSPAKPTKAVDKKGRVDYREALPPEDFARYSRLRDLRRELAEAEGVPVYTVFSNAQLAKMVTERVNTAVALAKIDGVGDAKLEKYGAQFLQLLKAEFPPASKPVDKGDNETQKD
ncbi:MAG: HRDC domain-containing protein [Gammaproteobacteria bacterium]|nr:HRDC domain-containing protein [Gammaproteobacteria bacterium]MBU1724033.1 HRDC domain-containing protein [Gammaproteobacteria bacterium]MBU2006898.1 HRDC domain-containing protein [Gammaproteobacteria bacterium]